MCKLMKCQALWVRYEKRLMLAANMFWINITETTTQKKETSETKAIIRNFKSFI